MAEHPITPAAGQAADAILALTNSRPQSPTHAELVTLIVKSFAKWLRANPKPHAPAASGENHELNLLADELRAAMPPLREAVGGVNNMLLSSKAYPAAQARFRECQARFDAARDRIWKLAPSSPEGCVVLAEIAQFDAYDWPEPYQQISLTGGDYMDGDPARLALGHLAMAVLRLGVKRHTAHGSGWRPSS